MKIDDININYDTCSFTESMIISDIHDLSKKIKNRGGIITADTVFLYVPNVDPHLTSSERRLHKRKRFQEKWGINDRARPTVRRSKESGTECLWKHKKLLELIKKEYKVKPLFQFKGNVYLRGRHCAIDFTSDENELMLKFFFDKNKIKIDREKLACSGQYQFERKNMVNENGVILTSISICPNDIKTYPLMLYSDSFEDISKNYPKTIAEKTQELIEKMKDDVVGKTIFLSGNPGTGKSYLIKCIAKEVKDYYAPVLISQAEQFFSNITNYYQLIDIMQNESRLMLIFEDVGKLFAKNNPYESIQTISTMLNLTDGLIGCSRDDIFIFTFNQDIGELEDAVIRQGRCLANMKFALFTAEEGIQWLIDNGIDKKTACEKVSRKGEESSISLATLYGILLEFSQVKTQDKEKRKLGFE